MKLVYIAGPYRSPTVRGIVENIRRAESLSLIVWRMGAAALCPHMNTAHFDGAITDEAILAGDREMLGRCDAVMLVSGWRHSEGTRDEVELARELGIPVFENRYELRRWLRTDHATVGRASDSELHDRAAVGQTTAEASESAGGASSGENRGPSLAPDLRGAASMTLDTCRRSGS